MFNISSNSTGIYGDELLWIDYSSLGIAQEPTKHPKLSCLLLYLFIYQWEIGLRFQPYL